MDPLPNVTHLRPGPRQGSGTCSEGRGVYCLLALVWTRRPLGLQIIATIFVDDVVVYKQCRCRATHDNERVMALVHVEIEPVDCVPAQQGPAWVQKTESNMSWHRHDRQNYITVAILFRIKKRKR